MNAPLFVGSIAEVCEYLRCSRTTLWRRMKDRPECFRRLGRTTVAVVAL